MKQFIFILFVIISQAFSVVYAQNTDKIKEIEDQITKALAEQDYEKAAELKDKKEIYLQIDEALKNQDYEKAATLKDKLTSEGNTPVSKKSQPTSNIESSKSNSNENDACQCLELSNKFANGELSEIETISKFVDSCSFLKEYTEAQLQELSTNCNEGGISHESNSSEKMNYTLSYDVANARIELNDKNIDPDTYQITNQDSLIKVLKSKYGSIPDSIKTLSRGRVMDVSPNGQFYLVSTINMNQMLERTGVYLLVETQYNTIANYYLPTTEEFSSMAFIDNTHFFGFEYTTGELKKYSIYSREHLLSNGSASSSNTKSEYGRLPAQEKEKKKKKKKSNISTQPSFRSPKYALYEMIVSANNKYVTTMTYSGIIHVFSTTDLKERIITFGGGLSLEKITGCNDDHFYCFVKNYDSKKTELYIVNYTEGSKSKILELDELDDPRSCDVYDDGRYILIGDQTAATLIDVQTKTILFKEQTKQFNVAYVEISNNGKFIAFNEVAQEARIFETQNEYSEVEKGKEIVPQVTKVIAQRFFFDAESSKLIFMVNGYAHYNLLPSVSLPLE